MKKSILSLVACAMLGSTIYADANKFEIGALGNYEFTDNDSALQTHLKSWGVRANYRIWNNILLGLEYDKSRKQKLRANPALKTDLQRYFLNGIYEANIDTSYTPYAFLGIGYQDIKKDSNSFDDGVAAQIGAGWKWRVLDFLNLFVEGKYIRDFKNSLDNFALGAGLSIPFGYEAKPEPKHVKPQPKDSDGDGVTDDLDACPHTPAGVKVDARGCALDSDQDGVPDYKDKCPNTPAGTEVDANGCKIVKDSDGDGVVDSLDKCPNTPAGVVVDKVGCPVVFNLKINFDFNSAKIKPEYLPKIKEVVEFMKAHPAYKAEIQGHTDNVGSAKYNKKLSEKRAKAVYDVMVQMGIDPNRLSYVGYGEERPIADNSTPEGRAENRRVEVHMLY